MAENKKNESDNKILETVLNTAFIEQRRSRRWGIFFKLVTMGYLIALLLLFLQGSNQVKATSGQFTALINLQGEIGTDLPVNASDFRESLKSAYSDPGTKGLIIALNSPGGSPVQSGMINDEIIRYKNEYPEIPVYAVIEDICASGGYYIAVATDKIYVDKASIVGSIGVLMNGFGFEEAIEKLGIERRLVTAGENKAILDPFLPINPRHKEHIDELLADVHQQFIDVVKLGRGDRLADNDDIFSGLFWTGEKAIQLGLADKIGNIQSVAKDEIGFEEIVDFTNYETFADRFAKQLGAGIGTTFSDYFYNKKYNNIQLR
jgi:protease-4